MKTKTRKGYDKMGAEEFFAWMAEDQAVTVSEVSNAEGSAGDQIVSWENDAGVSSPSSPPNNIMWAESPLEESPLTENPSTDGPSDMGGPEDFSADVDLEDGEKLTIEKEGGRSKKVLVGLLMLGGLYAAWSQSDAILDFYEKVVGDDSSEVEGCMDETDDNYNPDATVDDGSCNGGTNGTPEDNGDSDDS